MNGFDGELFAELGWSGDDQFVNFYAVTNSNDIAITKVQTFSFKLAGELPRMKDTDYCPPASAITVGDFDYDGYANEAALIYSDMATITLNVLQLTYAGTTSADTQFNVAEIYSSTLHTYQNSSSVVDRLRSMDGLASTLSVSVVTGDFDGDRKMEFAVAFRDNSGDGTLNGSNEVKFTGISGKIHVVVHKWDGSTFQNEEIVNGYDHWQYAPGNYEDVAGTPLSESRRCRHQRGWAG